ncbi:hypothetical protein AMK31_23370 [Streptomyces sp. TSRI0107]|nr:hypothetical protein AMK31_23370 [Streptomyces sp. TSRI0107]
MSSLSLLDLSLPQRLAVYSVEVVNSPIMDTGRFGSLLERRDGSRVLSLPAGRSAFERDTVARTLLAEGLGPDAPSVPAPLTVTRS